MVRVDHNDVPRIVQKVSYSCSGYLMKVRLFNGATVRMEPERLLRYPPGLFDRRMTKEQLADAYIAADCLFTDALYRELLKGDLEWESVALPCI